MYVIFELIRTMWLKLFIKPHKRYATELIIKLILGKMIKYNAK